MRMLLSLALTFVAVVPLFAQTPPPQQSVAVPPPDVAAPPANAVKTASGLASRIITPGTGKTHPGRTDLVTVHYTGWKTDGSMFDSSVLKGKPLTFGLDRVIAGWTEGVQLMVEGEKRRLWIPDTLAYKGQPTRPQGMLVFDVELISFMPSPTQPPPDVKAPPADAKRTASGLAYKVVRPGTGSRHPLASNTVTVHYSGWTTDGKLFDSSVVKGQPASFGLSDVIKGWTEGVQLMVVGEKTRFWIPEGLAYQGRSAPFGMLVFDIELLDIK
jgi:FKBP-type peptidyl-prolyl cis-trans isomerase